MLSSESELQNLSTLLVLLILPSLCCLPSGTANWANVREGYEVDCCRQLQEEPARNLDWPNVRSLLYVVKNLSQMQTK